MLYKEALQSHTLEEQAKQLESLNDQLAEAEQAMNCASRQFDCLSCVGSHPRLHIALFTSVTRG